MMSKHLDLTGMRFGRLVVIEFSHRTKYSKSIHIHWHCQCDCGNRSVAATGVLRDGRTRSCGCIKREGLRATHRMSKTPIYYNWGKMIERCTNPNQPRYKSYGGRGIIVCERWKKFERFFEDMGPSYFTSASLERKNVDGNYELSNCIWIERSEQAKNRQNSIIVDTPWGKMNAIYVAKKLGISAGTMFHRIHNWPMERWLEPKHH